MGLRNFIRGGGRAAWILIAAVVMTFAGSTLLLANTMEVRFERDVTRMVFNDNMELLEDVKRRLGIASDSLAKVLEASPTVPTNQPYIVVSIEERRLWYRQGDNTLFETRVAVGSGKTLVREGGGSHWQFDTPRGRLVVQSKETDPVWVPPDWHFLEVARKRGLGLIRLNRGQSVPAPDGSVITVEGNDVVKRMPDGSTIPLGGGEEGREIVAGGNVVVPPFGTTQRKFKGVLGTHRLNLGDGYALHGTNKPESIGQAVSHGCIRLRNEDIETLHRMVPVGTPVYIY